MKRALRTVTVTILLVSAIIPWIIDSGVPPIPQPALAAQTEPPQATQAEATETSLPARQEATVSRRIQDSLAETQDRVTELERQIDRLEGRRRNLALSIAELQLRELRFYRSRNTARTREAERTAIADRLDEINRNIIRLTTLMAILVEQHEPDDGPDASGAGQAEPDQ